jgi:hypothetical protein
MTEQDYTLEALARTIYHRYRYDEDGRSWDELPAHTRDAVRHVAETIIEIGGTGFARDFVEYCVSLSHNIPHPENADETPEQFTKRVLRESAIGDLLKCTGDHHYHCALRFRCQCDAL